MSRSYPESIVRVKCDLLGLMQNEPDNSFEKKAKKRLFRLDRGTLMQLYPCAADHTVDFVMMKKDLFIKLMNTTMESAATIPCAQMNVYVYCMQGFYLVHWLERQLPKLVAHKLLSAEDSRSLHVISN
jgi:hypothetical protein